MSRRANHRRFQQRGKEKNVKDFRRNKESIEQKVTFLIACEGKETEPNYLKALLSDLKDDGKVSRASVIFVSHGHTDPRGVLKDLLTHRKDGYQSKDYDERWIVVDRDQIRGNSGGHTKENFKSAIAEAKKKRIKVAYSNPCFEIWVLLHFCYYNTAIGRGDLLKKVKQYMPKYEKNSKEIYTELKLKLNIAIQNAAKLKSSYEINGHKVNPESDNPITNVFELVEKLQNPI